jgi:adenosylmethionine-8-amino-7-oxononanoate aminotransferase
MARRGDYKSFIGQPKKGKAVAWCGHYKHRGYLSLNNMRNHRCLEKQCRYFVKIAHPYWEERERKNADKKSKKKIRQIAELIRNGTAEEIADAISRLFTKGMDDV